MNHSVFLSQFNEAFLRLSPPRTWNVIKDNYAFSWTILLQFGGGMVYTCRRLLLYSSRNYGGRMVRPFWCGSRLYA
jgi:hypothetical protein